MEMHTRLVCGSKRMGSSKASAMPAGTPVTAAQSQQFPQEQSTMRAHSSSGSTAVVIDTKCACWLCYFCSVCVGRGLLFGVDDIYGLHQVGMQSSSSLQIARYF